MKGEEGRDDAKGPISILHRSLGKVRDGNLVKSGRRPRGRTSIFRGAKSMPICQIDFVRSDYCVSWNGAKRAQCEICPTGVAADFLFITTVSPFLIGKCAGCLILNGCLLVKWAAKMLQLIRAH